MNWQSTSEFLAMGGYGFYVWGSFGLGLLAFGAEYVFLMRRRTAILRSLRRQALAERVEMESS